MGSTGRSLSPRSIVNAGLTPCVRGDQRRDFADAERNRDIDAKRPARLDGLGGWCLVAVCSGDDVGGRRHLIECEQDADRCVNVAQALSLDDWTRQQFGAVWTMNGQALQEAVYQAAPRYVKALKRAPFKTAS
jgi:hypothetical protein